MIPKFAPECAAGVCELRNRDTSDEPTGDAHGWSLEHIAHQDSGETQRDDGRANMNAIKQYLLGAVAVAALLGAPSAQLNAQQTVPGISVGAGDLGGLVSGPNGPEAGVWVIAETSDLPTKFAKIVVTDDQGRYLLPDLPKAKYKVWVRGYGLVDSPKVDSEPGKLLNLTAVVAPSAAAAAEYYPAIYWFSMLGVPDKSAFPGTGPNGNG